MTKKMIIIVAAALLLSGCGKIEDNKNRDGAWTSHGQSCYTKIVEVEGHKYIVVTRSYDCITLQHAASCHCMEEEKKKKKLP